MEVHKLIIGRLFKKRKHIAIRNGIQVDDANRICLNLFKRISIRYGFFKIYCKKLSHLYYQKFLRMTHLQSTYDE